MPGLLLGPRHTLGIEQGVQLFRGKPRFLTRDFFADTNMRKCRCSTVSREQLCGHRYNIRTLVVSAARLRIALATEPSQAAIPDRHCWGERSRML